LQNVWKIKRLQLGFGGGLLPSLADFGVLEWLCWGVRRMLLTAGRFALELLGGFGKANKTVF